ncbi:MAG: hypothetical protein R2724_20370 [Bryobacterales bacterium]
MLLQLSLGPGRRVLQAWATGWNLTAVALHVSEAAGLRRWPARGGGWR